MERAKSVSAAAWILDTYACNICTAQAWHLPFVGMAVYRTCTPRILQQLRHWHVFYYHALNALMLGAVEKDHLGRSGQNDKFVRAGVGKGKISWRASAPHVPLPCRARDRYSRPARQSRSYDAKAKLYNDLRLLNRIRHLLSIKRLLKYSIASHTQRQVHLV